MKTLRIVVTILALATAPSVARAATITYSGYLDNAGSLAPAGGTLTNYCFCDLGSGVGTPEVTPTGFPDRNVALFNFTVAAPTAYTITSRGYNDVYGNTPNVDGFDAYVAIFSGTGGSAAWLEEFFNPIAPGDFQATSSLLAAGSYVLAISMWDNYPCGNGACFPSTGTLGDGFSGLSNLDPLRALYFEVTMNDGATPPAVPEPASLTLMLTGGAVLALRRARKSNLWRSGQ